MMVLKKTTSQKLKGYCAINKTKYSTMDPAKSIKEDILLQLFCSMRRIKENVIQNYGLYRNVN